LRNPKRSPTRADGENNSLYLRILEGIASLIAFT